MDIGILVNSLNAIEYGYEIIQNPNLIERGWEVAFKHPDKSFSFMKKWEAEKLLKQLWGEISNDNQ